MMNGKVSDSQVLHNSSMRAVWRKKSPKTPWTQWSRRPNKRRSIRRRQPGSSMYSAKDSRLVASPVLRHTWWWRWFLWTSTNRPTANRANKIRGSSCAIWSKPPSPPVSANGPVWAVTTSSWSDRTSACMWPWGKPAPTPSLASATTWRHTDAAHTPVPSACVWAVLNLQGL